MLIEHKAGLTLATAASVPMIFSHHMAHLPAFLLVLTFAIWWSLPGLEENVRRNLAKNIQFMALPGGVQQVILHIGIFFPCFVVFCGYILVQAIISAFI